MLHPSLRLAIRSLARNKGIALINIVGLTLGLCACLVIYDIVSYEFSFDRSAPGRDRIYRVGGRIRIDNGSGSINESYGKTIPAPAPDALRAEIPAIQTIAGYYSYNVSITIPGKKGQTGTRLQPSGTSILADHRYFDIFPYTWLAGDPVHSLGRPYGVVLTASRARDYFGKLPAAQYLNRELVYDDSLHVRVTGIIKDYEANTDFPYTDFISFSTISHSFLKNKYRNDEWAFNPAIPRIQALARLTRNADPKRAAALFDSVWQRHNPAGSFEQFLKFSIVIQPLADVHFNEAYGNDGIRKAHLPTLYGLIGGAVFILLLAIINFINLSTAHALQQAKDISIRRLLGATPFRIMRSSLTETAILTTLSAVIALLLVRPVMALFNNYLPESLPLNPFTSANFLFAGGCVIATTILAGLYPATRLIRLQSDRMVQTQTFKKLPARRALIVFQYSISLLFIIASLVVGRQIRYMLTADMGFNSSAVVTITGNNAAPNQVRRFARQALAIPGVQAFTMQNHAPTEGPVIQYPMKLDGGGENGLSVDLQTGDEHFIPFYQMRLLAGHNLSAGDSLREFIINDTYRRALGFAKPADAIGHQLSWGSKTLPISGVVEDFHSSSLHMPIPAMAIARLANLDNSIGLRITPGNNQTLARLNALWNDQFPGQPFQYTFLDDSIGQLYKKDRQLSWLVDISTAVIVLISCIGLFGLILFTIERKKKEISIRKVLGGRITDILIMLNKEFIVLVAIALVIASPIAFLGMNRWLQGFAYRVQIPWWIFILAGLIIISISLLTISLRVVRAATVNPTDNLRAE